MNYTDTYSTNQGVFQEFLGMLGKMVHSKLIRQIEYLKVENQILRAKTGKRISLTHEEKQRLLKFGLALGADIKRFISIVNYRLIKAKSLGINHHPGASSIWIKPSRTSDMKWMMTPLHNRLEPTQLVDSTTDWEALYAQNKKWGPSRMSQGGTSLFLTNAYI